MATPYCTARPTYIYALCEPDAPWNVRYIGKVLAKEGESSGTAIVRRLQWHFYECHYPDNKTRRHRWLQHLSVQDKTPAYYLIDCGDEVSWKKLECFYIKAYRAAGFDLTNLTDGGDGVQGYIISLEARLKISRANKGRKQTKDWIEKRTVPRRGKKLALETITKMSKAKKGKPSPLKGRPCPDSVRRAVSEANRKRKWSAESIAKREATKRTKRAQSKPPL